MTFDTPTDRPMSACNRYVIDEFGGVFVLSLCILEFSVGVRASVIGLSQTSSLFSHSVTSKIEKVPRGIRGEKSSIDMASSRNLVSTIGALASPKLGDGTRCPEG